MKIWLTLAFVWMVAPVQAQFHLEFQHVSHEFGLIPENGGNVSHDFWFTNTGEEQLIVVDAEVSCGCTIPLWQQEAVLPGDSAFVRISYDPKGRPGEFSKPVTVYFESNGEKFKRFLNVSGWTLTGGQMDSLSTFTTSSDPSQLQIQIAPARYPTSISNDTLLEGARFNRFVNDLTYVLDKDHLVNVEILWVSNKAMSTERIEEISRTIKRGLLERGYESYQAGISFRKLSLIQAAQMGEDAETILLVVPSYHAPKLEKSVVQAPDPIAETEEAMARRGMDGMKFSAPCDHKKWYREERSYQQFLRTLTYDILEDGKAEMQLVMRRESPDKSVAKIASQAEKLADKTRETLLKDLEDRGVTRDMVLWKEDKIDVSRSKSGAVDESKVSYIEFRLVYSDPTPIDAPVEISEETGGYEETRDPAAILPDSAGEATVLTNSMLAERVKLFPKQTLPVYQRFFSHDNKQIDTTGADFIAMMDLVLAEMKAGHPIQFLVESSASKSPTSSQYDNQFIARQRARETQTTLTQYLKNRGVSESEIEFITPVCLVQGPDYNRRYFEVNFYKQFQYLKVIPLYKSIYDIKKDASLSPYMITFDYNNSEVVSGSPVFRKFVKDLVPVIERQGYVRIIIESSASTVPTSSHKRNNILAYNRANDARTKLTAALESYGVDSKRLIVTEEKPLVQGPEYQGSYEKFRVMYARYQYIKIIPNTLLEK